MGTLFLLGEKGPEISPEALAIKEYGDIWRRDRKSDKRTAVAELAYVYYALDPKSQYYDMEPVKQMKTLCKDLGLGKDWRPDAKVLAAMERYPEDTQTPVTKAVAGMLMIFRTVYDSIAYTQGALRKILEVTQEIEFLSKIHSDEEQLALLERAEKASAKVITHIKALLDVSIKLPPTVEALNVLKENVEREKSDARTAKGGQEIGYFED